MQGPDLDLDSFLYLGSRLANGELLYFNDFETKLPLLQYVFWVPYQLGGIGAWRLITFTLSFLLALVSSRLIVRSLTQNSKDLAFSSRTITALSASVFLSFLYSLPGSSSAHIEMFAAIFMYYAIALWHRALANKNRANVCVLLSGVVAAIAVSIRPNYLFTIPAFMLVAVMVISRSIGLEKHAAIKQGALFVLAVSLITATQFVPYFFLKNGPSVLLSGLQALLHFPEGSSFIDIVESQFLTKDTLGFYIFMCISAGAMVYILIAHSKERRSDLTASIMLLGTLLSLASIMGIEYSAIKTHYHWHYSIMYVPYATVFFTYLCVIVCERRATWPTMVKYSLFLIGLSVWYFSVVGVQLLNLAQTTFKPELSLLINHRNIDSGLRDFLTKVISRGMTFYVPENFNYHRLLNQTRIGDGHRAMLREVLSGGRVGPVASIFLYSDVVYKAPCLSLWESQKDLIIVGPGRNLRPSGTPSGSTNGLVLRCLLQAASGYEEIPSDHTNYRIFARRQALGQLGELSSLSW